MALLRGMELSDSMSLLIPRHTTCMNTVRRMLKVKGGILRGNGEKDDGKGNEKPDELKVK